MNQLRLILRRFRRSPGFTAIALLTLAIGIGANTAIFSVVNSVQIQPLPYPDADRLVGVWHVAPGVAGLGGDLNMSPTMYFTYGEENETLENFGIWNAGGASVTGIGDPEQVQTVTLTHGTLDALGVAPVLGRWFSEEDASPGGAEDSVILSYGYWQSRLGGDAQVVGTRIEVDARPRTVIGVMPEGFRFLNNDAQMFLPFRFERDELFLGNFSFQGLARLRSGASLDQANADVARMIPIWMESWPAPPGLDKSLFENAGLGPLIRPLKQDVVGDIGPTLWVLMGTIGLVLVIACANVANLLLVRAESRQHELGVRSALGAGRARLVREMLLESVTLGLAGGAVGTVLAFVGLRIFVASGPATLPRLNEVGIDLWALAFAVAASLVSGLCFGLIPALKHAGPQIAHVLRGGGRTMSQSRERHRARNVLVVVQVALALVLLVGSGLMLRTFQAMRGVSPGFAAPDEVQLVRISIPEAQVEEPERVTRLQQEMLERLTAIPGVDSATFANGMPMGFTNWNDLIYAQDREYAEGEIPALRRFRFAAPGYFRTLGVPLIVGRDLTWTDVLETRDVALVSDNLARELWNSPDAAIGRRVRTDAGSPWREVVGVVGDVYEDGVHQEPPTMVYWPVMVGDFYGNDFQASRSVVFAMRSSRAASEGFLDEVRQAIWSVSPNLPVFLVRTLGDAYDQSMARTSFTLVMLGIAGAMALVLGIVGIYGVIAYAVTERTREIGVRMALGAERGRLQTMFLRYGLTLGALGAVIGSVAALGLTRLMESLLFETSPLDPATYALVATIVVSAAVIASYLPARRAAGMDPVVALRSD